MAGAIYDWPILPVAEILVDETFVFCFYRWSHANCHVSYVNKVSADYGSCLGLGILWKSIVNIATPKTVSNQHQLI